MFCGKCGAENENGAKFCKGCGAPLSSENTAKENNGVAMGNATAKANVDIKASLGPAIEKIKSLPKWAMAAIPVAVIALIVLICVLVNSGKTIDLNDYLIVEFSGYDGYGKARVDIDWDAIEKKYGSKAKFTSEAKKKFGDWFEGESPIEVLSECVYVELDKTSKLSNGDEVKIKFEFDEDFNVAKYLNLKLKYKDTSKKVEGLKEVGKFDAFAKLSIEYSGVAPFAYMNLSYTGTELPDYAFECETRSELKNGDKIKITINDDYIINCIEQFGVAPQEMEKEYTVSGLQSFLTKVSDLDEAIKNKLKSKAEEYYNAKNRDEDEEELKSLEYVGECLLTPKSESFWGSTSNYLYLVYKVTIRNHYESYDQENVYYWYARFSNVLIDEDGKIECTDDSLREPDDYVNIKSGVYSWFWEHSWSYYGYETIDALYKAVITNNADSYSGDSNIK